MLHSVLFMAGWGYIRVHMMAALQVDGGRGVYIRVCVSAIIIGWIRVHLENRLPNTAVSSWCPQNAPSRHWWSCHSSDSMATDFILGQVIQ